MWWQWIIWFFLWSTLAIVSFAFLEAYAFRHPTRSWTLSRSIATLGQNFPLTLVLWGFIWGLLLGGLSVHFFWHFCL